MVEKKKHTHKLKKVKYKSGNQVLFCVLEDCSFKINPALALGKKSICWRCDKEFNLNEYSIRLVKPHCEECHKSKNNDNANDIAVTQENNDEIIHELSLSERLQQTIKQRTEEQEDEL